jgi:secondary thiamine-phosphate synthase enzyme
MKSMIIKTTKKDEVKDVTSDVENFLDNSGSGVCHIFVSHTTACITTADLDPGTDLDTLNALRHILPDGVLEFNHPHDPSHTPDHILSSIIGPSLTIPVKDGKLELGVWQRIVLIELDGPRERKVYLSFIPTN